MCTRVTQIFAASSPLCFHFFPGPYRRGLRAYCVFLHGHSSLMRFFLCPLRGTNPPSPSHFPSSNPKNRFNSNALITKGSFIFMRRPSLPLYLYIPLSLSQYSSLSISLFFFSSHCLVFLFLVLPFPPKNNYIQILQLTHYFVSFYVKNNSD